MAHQDKSYRLAVAEHGPALGRLVRAYEADADLRRDLLQEIHIGLWRSLARSTGDARCAPGFIAWRTISRPHM